MERVSSGFYERAPTGPLVGPRAASSRSQATKASLLSALRWRRRLTTWMAVAGSKPRSTNVRATTSPERFNPALQRTSTLWPSSSQADTCCASRRIVSSSGTSASAMNHERPCCPLGRGERRLPLAQREMTTSNRPSSGAVRLPPCHKPGITSCQTARRNLTLSSPLLRVAGRTLQEAKTQGRRRSPLYLNRQRRLS